MKAIETTVQIGPDRKLVVQLPPDIPVGEHHVVLVVGEPISVGPTETPWPSGAIP